MRICDPFREAGLWFVVAEHHFELQCVCGVTQRADALLTRVSGDVTLYDCVHCATSLIAIAADEGASVTSAPQTTPTDEDAIRMCGYAFGSTVDMALWPPAAVESFLDIPARPGFLGTRGCDGGTHESS